MSKKENISEDIPTNNVSSGQVAGVGAGGMEDIKVAKKKKDFEDGMKKRLSESIFIKEKFTIHKKMSSDEKKTIEDNLSRNGNNEHGTDDNEGGAKKAKKDLYIWRTSNSVKEKIDKIIDDFNEKHHSTDPISQKTYVDSSFTKLYLRGDSILRKQIKNSLESAGAKKVVISSKKIKDGNDEKEKE